MKAGKLRRVVTVQGSTHTVNEAGTPVVTWADKATLRAEVVQQSTAEFIRGFGASDETVVVFRTRFIAGVTNADRIVFGGEAFNIREVVVTGNDRGLELRCARAG